MNTSENTVTLNAICWCSLWIAFGTMPMLLVSTLRAGRDLETWLRRVMQREGMLKNKEVPLWETNIGKGLREAANGAYYGGRFEAPIIGDVQGPVYQADINSAYAAVYRNLPCLIHGAWNNWDLKQALIIAGVFLSGSITIVTAMIFIYADYQYGPVRAPLPFHVAGNGIYWSMKSTLLLRTLIAYVWALAILMRLRATATRSIGYIKSTITGWK